MSRLIDLTGRRFSRLVVLGGAEKHGTKITWLCRCDCGKELRVIGQSLRRGATRSCGCLDQEVKFKHGKNFDNSRAYRVWHGMKQRCLNPKDKGYPNYGGRGIKLDPRWLDFRNFLADMGEPPPGTLIERRDNNGPYSPSNCCWATYKEQQNNKRDNVLVTIGKRTQTLQLWIDEFGLEADAEAIRMRVRKGVKPEIALVTPVKKYVKLTYSGKTLSVSEWARRYGLNPDTLQKRLHKGLSLEEALKKPITPPGQRRWKNKND